MDCKIIALDSFKIVGKKANFSTVNGENLQEIPKMWGAANASGLDGELAKVSNGQIEGILGVCKSTKEQPTLMDYWIAVTADDDYDEYESEVIPAS
ncbi:MAG TPA: AraC family transcriptional regulator, partial [Kurthia sp.]